MLLSHLLDNNLVSTSSVNRIMLQCASQMHPRYHELTLKHKYRFYSVNWLTNLGITEVFLDELASLMKSMPNVEVRFGVSEFLVLKTVLAHYLTTRHRCAIPKYFTETLLENEYRLLDHVAKAKYEKTNKAFITRLNRHIDQAFPETLRLLSIGVHSSSADLRGIIFTGNIDVEEQLRIPMGFSIDPVLQVITIIY